MNATELDAIKANVLQLWLTQRAHLAWRLLASLNKDDDTLTARIAEAESRADALVRGDTTSMSLDEAMAKARIVLAKV